jgi:drug/metabolite transporter (DMT)-like permease
MPSGALLCLASAAAFGGMGILGTLAYDDGATVGTLLASRFVIAAALFWGLAALGGGWRALRALRRRDVAAALSLGGVYSVQAGCYFTALGRIDPGLLALLLYTFPSIVAVAAIATGRERAEARTGVALALGTAGLALVVAGAGAGALDPVGTALGLATAVVYSGYVLVTSGLASRVPPLVLSALVCTGAAATLTPAAAAAGDLHPGAVSPAGLVWLAAIAVVSTVAAVSLFFAGMARVGPTSASILSTAEPLTAVVLAGVVLGQALAPVQLAGAALVGGAVVVLARRGARRPSGASVIIRRPRPRPPTPRSAP